MKGPGLNAGAMLFVSGMTTFNLRSSLIQGRWCWLAFEIATLICSTLVLARELRRGL